ncbi:PH domain-containing protein [Nocardia africana]|uniref:PH domain-containing protein n=1 Tax=Nocardia africana TaxID=134964 RepID=A0ABW6NS14_9NOCA
MTDSVRPDIAEAAAAMRPKPDRGRRKLIDQLATQLQPGETVLALAGGWTDNNALLSATSHRVIISNVGIVLSRATFEAIPYENVTGIKLNAGMLLSAIDIHTPGVHRHVKNMNTVSAAHITEVLTRQLAAAQQQQTTPVAPQAVAPVTLVADELRKLADLHAAEVLTAEEFAAQKARLLA